MTARKGNIFLIVLLIAAGVAIGASTMRWTSKNVPQPIPTPETKPSDPTATWKIYQNDELGFSLKYPQEVFPYADPLITGRSGLFIATSAPKGGNSPKFFGQTDLWLEAGVNAMTNLQSMSQLDQFISSNPSLSKAQKSNTTIGGSLGYKLSYQVQVAAAGTHSVTEYVYEGMVLRNGNLFAITLSSWSQDALNQKAVLFDQILSTFKFLDQNSTKVTGQVAIYTMDEKSMTIQLTAQSSSGNIKDMMIWTNSQQSSQWAPFQTLVKLPVSDHVYAKFRDEAGNESEVYSDSTFPPNSPPPVKN